MSYQLWTSPITGYRRTGTRLSELRNLFEAGITARAVLEPLQSCSADADAREIEKILCARGFDLAGVQEHPQGPVIGFVERGSLESGIVRDYLQPIRVEDVISEATPLASLLSIFKTRERAFVLAASRIEGIITRADLNKPPVRIYLFGLISLLDMHLSFWVQDAYPNENWKEMLAEIRLTKAERLCAERRARNQEINIIDCLQFCDKGDLVLARRDLRESIGLGSGHKTREMLKRSESLRNLLVHSQQELTQGSSWLEVIEVVEWSEKVVHKSDALVEEKASLSARGESGKLWGTGRTG